LISTYFINKVQIFLNLYTLTAVPNQLPRKKKKDEWKVHDTGCGRTEGYYKVDSKQKANHKVNIACKKLLLPKFIL